MYKWRLFSTPLPIENTWISMGRTAVSCGELSSFDVASGDDAFRLDEAPAVCDKYDTIRFILFRSIFNHIRII